MKRLCSVAQGRCFLLLAILALGRPFLASEATTSNTPLGASTPLGLLQESYQTSRNFEPEQRAWLLFRLAKAAVHKSPANSRSWSKELFSLAASLPPTWNKLAFEKNAVVTLFQTDPKEAIRLFRNMDDPIAMASGALPEDVRSEAAQVAFQQLLIIQRGRRGLNTIEQIAQHLGETGEYPYAAVTPIVKQLALTDAARSQAFYMQALQYYRRGSKFLDENRMFIQFLQNLKEQLSRGQLRMGLDPVVTRLLEQKSAAESNQRYRAQVSTTKGVVEFRDPSDQMLFELLPLVHEVDSNWAEDLMQRRPILSKMASTAGPVQHMESSTVFGGSGAGDALAAEQSAIEEGRLYNIQKIGGTRPDEALGLASTLTVPSLQAQAWAEIAAAVATKDRDRALILIDKARDATGRLKDQLDILRVLSDLGEAAAAAGDEKVLRESLEQGIDLGSEIFEEDLIAHPGALAYNVDGFDEITKLSEVGAKYEPTYTLSRVRQVREDLLRAHLLVSVAEGLAP